MPTLDARIAKLERQQPPTRMTDLALACSAKGLAMLSEEEIMCVLLTCAHECGPLVLEKFRGKVDDRVIRAGYNAMRNYAFPEELAFQVRRLAGVIDEHGKVMKRYVLLENGCIVNADEAAISREMNR